MSSHELRLLTEKNDDARRRFPFHFLFLLLTASRLDAGGRHETMKTEFFSFFFLVSFTYQKEMAKLSDKSFGGHHGYDIAPEVTSRQSVLGVKNRFGTRQCLRAKRDHLLSVDATAVSRSSFCVCCHQTPQKSDTTNPFNLSIPMQHLAGKKTQKKADTRTPKTCVKSTL